MDPHDNFIYVSSNESRMDLWKGGGENEATRFGPTSPTCTGSTEDDQT